MTAPTLSVLSANYNHAAYLPHALDALLAQSYRPLEIILIDDASTDDSLSIIERYRQRAPGLLRVVRNERNQGVLGIIDQLMSMAKGDYVYFAAADDLVLPGLFERSMRLLTQHPQAALCTSLTRVIDVHGQDTEYVPVGPFESASEGYITPEECRRSLRERDFRILGPSTIYHRQRLVEAGGFRRSLGAFCDGFLAQALALRHGACYVPAVLAAGRWTGANYSMTSFNPQQALAIHDAVLDLMRGDFADVFPSGFVATWRQRSYYNIVATMLRDLNRRGGKHLRDIAGHGGPGIGFVARVASALLSLGTHTAVLTAAAVLRWQELRRAHHAFSAQARSNRARLRQLGAR